MTRVRWNTVYVTGGSSGIGYAVAERAAITGSDTILIARSREKLDKAVEALREKGDGKIHAVALDVRNRKEVEESFPKLIAEYGAPELLVNSAGAAYPEYFEEISYERFRQSIDINLEGTWNVTQVAVRDMKSGSWIVNVSSIAGFAGLFGYTAYSASKFAVVGFSESLRNELSGRGIGVSVLFPPDTRTPGFEEEERTKPEETRELSGNARPMQPSEVAEAMLRGLKKQSFFIVPGFQGKMIYWIKRLCPGVVFKIMDREVRKVEKRKNKRNG